MTAVLYVADYAVGGARVRQRTTDHRLSGAARWGVLACLCGIVGATACAWASETEARPWGLTKGAVEQAIVLTQFPVTHAAAGGAIGALSTEEGRLLVVRPDGTTRLLSEGFHSASDPDVSFDGTRLLFSGKKRASDRWGIFEMNVDGSNVRPIRQDVNDCRCPRYQSALYVIVEATPRYQITFVSSTPGGMNECGVGTLTNLYSCKLDGTEVKQLTFNLSSDADPYLMPDGRLVFSSWQRARFNHGSWGRIGLFGVNMDGTDYAAFSTDEGQLAKGMPCVTARRRVVFVEVDEMARYGGGSLGSVTIQRPLHSYRPVTRQDQGVFYSPSPLPDGRILVSRLSQGEEGTYGLGVLDPENGRFDPLFDDPQQHDIQARAICPRPEPDGRSSVVSEADPNGKLYCLSMYTHDLTESDLPRGSVTRLRVLEGLPVRGESGAGRAGPHGIPAVAPRRFLGEVPIAADGSFNVEIPANTPIELQILDKQGMALRSCGWIWAKNHEPRGCIGCHEDGELAPENVLVEALKRPSVKLTLPPERRRTVDFRREVMPILAGKCVSCHREGDSPLRLTTDPAPASGPEGTSSFNRNYESLLEGAENGSGRYVHSGKARTSPLVWRLYGRNTSRPWDGIAASGQAVAQMPPDTSPGLTDEERRTFVEWIDLGAPWEGIPNPTPSPERGR